MPPAGWRRGTAAVLGVVEVAEYFREHQLVPSYDIGDSLHLALAVVHRLSVLATWNFRHLANPRKRRHLAVLCRRLSLSASDVVSPEELLEEIREVYDGNVVFGNDLDVF